MARRTLIEILSLIILGVLIIVIAQIRIYSDSEDILIPESDKPEPSISYGIVIDSMLVMKGNVEKNEFLADILLRHGIDYPTIDRMVKAAKGVFDVRKIKKGDSYTFICENDSLQKVQYFVIENSVIDYTVFDLRDSIHVHQGEKEMEVREQIATGTIQSSLWNTMIENNTNPVLALELSEVYAWAIDFFGIQKGDQYKVVYEELYVDSTSIDIGKVKSAVFNHMGRDFYAFYFIQDSVGDYFDEEANSLRRTFLKAPLRYKRISSGFSYTRKHPILKKVMPHLGVDYAAAAGTPVHAVGDGKVIFAAYKGPNGNMVKIKHNGTYTTAYLHLSKFGKGVKSGVYVNQGDVIGYVGSTGRSTGPHLDFRFYKNGKAVNPLKVESPPAKPVDSVYLDTFNILIKKQMDYLGTIAY